MPDVLEPFGPMYPDLGAGVAKFRRKAAQAGSIREMSKADRRAYADAIEKAIRAKHRVLHMRPNPPTTPGWYSPPSITRLLRYDKPIKMQGDPNWLVHCKCPRYQTCYCDPWGARQAAVYEHTMEQKSAAQGVFA